LNNYKKEVVLKQRLLFLALGCAVLFSTRSFAGDKSADTTANSDTNVAAVSSAEVPAEKSTIATDPDKLTYSPSGFGTLQMLRFDNWKYKGSDMGGQVTGNVVANLTLDFKRGNNFQFHVGVEGYIWYNTIPIDLIHEFASMMKPIWSFYIHRADAIYTFGNPDVFGCDLDLGYFTYKYDPDVRNLGEYMFRSGTYPGWTITNFDWTTARLAGMRFGCDAFNKVWHNDFLLTSETDFYPFYDVSLSWITSIKPFGRILDIGGGVDFARLFPANADYTTPKKSDNIKELSNPRTTTVTDSTTGLPVTQTVYDTSYYTYKGTKLMGRIAFDFKGFLPNSAMNIFGENDGRLYGEVAVLGLENQGVDNPALGLTAYYDKLWQRIPLMFGFNIPTFKFMDVLSLEAEYYRMPYPNDYGPQLRWSSTTQGSPVPSPGLSNYQMTVTNVYDTDSWKWSVYARKFINKNFAVILQAARDHNRTMSSYALYEDGEEAFTRNNQWYWAVKLVSVF
jgi:hypothetical protein